MTNKAEKKKKKFKITKHWILDAILAGIIGLLITEIYVGVKNLNPFYKEKITNEKPVLIGIYPSNGFGLDQKKGVVECHKEYGSDIELIHLDNLTVSQMKSKEIISYTNKLQQLLKSRNVMGIVGPSVTESSLEIIECVEKNKCYVPTLLMTAASKRYLNWEAQIKETPLFRLCTDIDLRSKEISGFIKRTIESNKDVAFIVEESEDYTTYGMQFLSTIKKEYDPAAFDRATGSKKIRIEKFDKNLISTELKDKRFHDLFSEERTILFLGIGSQFKKFIDFHYVKEKSPKAMFGGWLNTYAYNKELEDGKYHSNKIFEISDFDINAYEFSTPEAQLEHFLLSGGKLEPPYRDFALGYDACFIVLESYKYLSEGKEKYLKFNKYSCDKLVEQIRAGEEGIWKGVTGEISFSKIGENIRKIHFMKYEENQWKKVLKADEIIDENIQ